MPEASAVHAIMAMFSTKITALLSPSWLILPSTTLSAALKNSQSSERLEDSQLDYSELIILITLTYQSKIIQTL